MRKTCSQSAKAKIARRAYARSGQGKAKIKVHQRTYSHSEGGKATIGAYRRAYQQKEAYKSYQRNWERTHKAVRSRRRRERYATDPLFRLRQCVSAAVCDALKAVGRSKKGESTFAHLPYTVQELKEHLEAQWELWMGWDNYGRGLGKWTIDHVVPQFDFHYESLDDPEFQKCWALENLRPLGFIENIRKGNRRERLSA